MTTIIIKRIGKGLGDIAAMVRAIELIRLKYPTARIIVITRYPDLVRKHPAIDEVIESDRDFSFPDNDVFIDLDIISLDRTKARHQVFCERVSEEFAKKDMEGIEWDGLPQNLWVSRDDNLWAKQLIANAARGKIPVGIFWRSEERWRTWRKMKALVRLLVDSNCAVFCFDAKEKFPIVDGVNQIVGYTLDKVMALVSNMRLVVSNDSGGLHIAGGLGVSTVAIFGATDPLTIAGMYNNIHWIPVSCSKHPCWRSYCLTVSCLRRIKPIDVYDKVEELITGKPVKRRGKYRRNTIAIHRLDGMGGTLTVSDHAMKFKQRYPDHKVVLIIRGFSQLFDGNPNVDDIIEVGSVKWEDSLDNHRRKYTSLIDVRFAIPKIYGKGAVGQKFLQFQRLYDSFPLGQQRLDSHGLHHVQLADKILGLPYDTIDVGVFFKLPPNIVSGDYIVVNNGVDVIYRGKKQTKSWTYWKELVELLDVKCIQVGTTHDSPIYGAIDLRGKTSIKALGSVLKGAKAIIVGEGGIAHYAYALGCSNVIVVRGPTASKLLAYPGHIQVDSYPCKNCFFSTPDWFFKCPMNMIDPVCMASISPERVVRVYEGLVKDTLKDLRESPLRRPGGLDGEISTYRGSNAPTRSTRGVYWYMRYMIDKMIWGDCLEVMPDIPDGSIDAILCDLPYGTTTCKWDSIIPLEPLWEQYRRIIKPNGAIVLTASQPFTTKLIASNMEMFKYCWVWEKSRPTNPVHAKNMPMKLHEDICIFAPGVISHKGQSDRRMTYNPQGLSRIDAKRYRPSRKNGSDVNMGDRPSLKCNWVQTHTGYPASILIISSQHNVKAYHPTQKPVPLFEYLIKTYTNEGEIILDNCIGSGTTAIAAIRSNRHFIGIEKDAKYCLLARNRIRKEIKSGG